MAFALNKSSIGLVNTVPNSSQISQIDSLYTKMVATQISGITSTQVNMMKTIALSTAQIASLNTQMTVNTSTIALNTQQISTLNSTASALTTQMTANTSALSSATSAIALNTQQISALNTQTQANTSALSSATAQIALTSTQLSALNTQTQANTSAIASTASAIALNTQQISALNTQTLQNTNNISTLTNELNSILSVSGNITALTTQVLTNTTNIASLTTQVNLNATNIQTLVNDITTLDGDISTLQSTKANLSLINQANGICPLDSSGKIPAGNLTVDVMQYLGAWNASNNTPHIQDGTGVVGDIYRVSVGGSQTFGGSLINFMAGDSLLYNGSIWQQVNNSNNITSVFTRQGDITAIATDYSAYYPLLTDYNNEINAINADFLNINNEITTLNALTTQILPNKNNISSLTTQMNVLNALTTQIIPSQTQINNLSTQITAINNYNTTNTTNINALSASIQLCPTLTYLQTNYNTALQESINLASYQTVSGMASYYTTSQIATLNTQFATTAQVNALSTAIPSKSFELSKTFYVSPSGSDTNDGSINQPFLTIGHAISACGTNQNYYTIYITNGTYNENININRTRLIFKGLASGSNSISVQIQGYVDIDLTSYTYTPTLYQDYIIFSNILINGSSTSGVASFQFNTVNFACQVLVENCYINSSVASNITTSSTGTTGQTSRLNMLRTTVQCSNNSYATVAISGINLWSIDTCQFYHTGSNYALTLSNTSSVYVITNTTIQSNSNGAISILCNGGTFSNCIFLGISASGCIQVGNTSTNIGSASSPLTIRGSAIFNTYTSGSAIYMNGGASGIIYMAIYDNSLYGVSYAVQGTSASYNILQYIKNTYAGASTFNGLTSIIIPTDDPQISYNKATSDLRYITTTQLSNYTLLTTLSTTQIALLNTSYGSISNINTLSGNLQTLSGNLQTVSGSITTLSGSITTLTANITTLSGTATLLSGQISALTTRSSGATVSYPLVGSLSNANNLAIFTQFSNTGTDNQSNTTTGTGVQLMMVNDNTKTGSTINSSLCKGVCQFQIQTTTGNITSGGTNSYTIVNNGTSITHNLVGTVNSSSFVVDGSVPISNSLQLATKAYVDNAGSGNSVPSWVASYPYAPLSYWIDINGLTKYNSPSGIDSNGNYYWTPTNTGSWSSAFYQPSLAFTPGCMQFLAYTIQTTGSYSSNALTSDAMTIGIASAGSFSSYPINGKLYTSLQNCLQNNGLYFHNGAPNNGLDVSWLSYGCPRFQANGRILSGASSMQSACSQASSITTGTWMGLPVQSGYLSSAYSTLNPKGFILCMYWDNLEIIYLYQDGSNNWHQSCVSISNSLTSAFTPNYLYYSMQFYPFINFANNYQYKITLVKDVSIFGYKQEFNEQNLANKFNVA